MYAQLAWNTGYDDGAMGAVALPFDGWETLSESFAYLRGYYAGKKSQKTS